MNAALLAVLPPWLEPRYCTWLTEALIHFLWQGCAIAAIYAIVERPLQRASAGARYVVGLAALVVMVACVPATLWVIAPAQVQTADASLPMQQNAFVPAARSDQDAAMIASAMVPSDAMPESHPPVSQAGIETGVSPSQRHDSWNFDLLAGAAPYATTVYLFGVALMLIRVAIAQCGARRLKNSSIPVIEPALLAELHAQALRFGLYVVPAIAFCHRVSVPVVVGVLRPMILLPAALATGASASVLRAVLAHELAHIRRYDLLFNLAQRLIEAVLFFHPAVWWVSRRVSLERECACDDLVLRTNPSRIEYAAALVCAAEFFASRRIDLASGASLATTGGNVSSFKRRILRLLGKDEPVRLGLTPVAMTMTAVITCLLLIAPATWRTSASAQPAIVDATSERHVLHFPNDSAMGIVFTRPRSEASYSHADWTVAGEARGEVLVPSDSDVKLQISKTASEDLSGLDALGPNDVQVVVLRDTDVTDDGLKQLGRLTGLRLIDLNETRITDAGIRHLGQLKVLQEIMLSAYKVKDQGFGVGDEALRILSQLPDLERITLRSTKITDTGVGYLDRLQSLKCLQIEGTAVTNVGLSKLSGLSRLEVLSLGAYDEGADITDDGLIHIGALTNLKHLSLSGTKITDQGLVHLKSLKHLEDLNLEATQVTEGGLALLEPLDALQELRLYTRSSVTDVGAAHLAKLKSLRIITDNLDVTDRGVALLATLPHLERLSLKDRVTDASLEHLAQVKSLKWLHLQGCPITDKGLAALASLSNLEFLQISRTHVTGDGLSQLVGLPNLTILMVDFGDRDSQPAGLQPHLRAIGKLKQLKDLRIRGDGLTSRDLQDLTSLRAVEKLDVDLPVDDEGAVHLAGLDQMRGLQISQGVLTDIGIKRLANLRNLKYLLVSGHFTDKSLTNLEKMRSLEMVRLYSPYVTENAVKSLASKLPSLQSASSGWSAQRLGDITTSEKDTIRRDGDQDIRAKLDPLEDNAPPPLDLTGWLNTGNEPLSLQSLRGKVVLVDFWGEWCGPCRTLTPTLKDLHEKYHAKGLVILGVHTTNGAEKMSDYVAKEKIEWPVAVDVSKNTVQSWKVESYPTLSLIDRSGTLRFAGIYRGDIERAVVQLLNEVSEPKP